jgi:5'-nucleotidase
VLDLRRARILVANDDGIHSPGLAALADVARSLSRDVWVVAPENEQSASGHSLTLTVPLRIRQLDTRRFAVNGTPTDCVLLAVRHILGERRPDLVLSGFNSGGNLGEDITYSGTVAAAMEATLLGIPAIALSQARASGKTPKWKTASAHAGKVIRRLAAADWPRNVLINVNFPDITAKKVGGIAVTRQGRHKIGEMLTKGVDPRGNPYIWIGTERDEDPSFPGSDLQAIHARKISITPLCLDLTHTQTMTDLAKVFA